MSRVPDSGIKRKPPNERGRQDSYTPKSTIRPVGSTPFTCGLTPPTDPRPFICNLPSHCDSLFSGLRSLRDQGQFLDLSLQLNGASYRAHGLVLAAVSHTAEAWLRCGKAGAEMELLNGQVSQAGLQAVLEFAYTGSSGTAIDMTGDDILETCRFLGVERLARNLPREMETGSPLSPANSEMETSLGVIRRLWKEEVGCDVWLQTDSGESLPAHRAVLAAGGDYFRALLCGGLRESSEKAISLRGVASWVLREILEFLYSGTLRLGREDVWGLAEAALIFQLQEVFLLCEEFLLEHIDPSSCLDILALAEAYGLDQLGRKAEQYTLRQFHSVSSGDKFQDLPLPLLERLLEKDSLCVDSEVLVVVGGDFVDEDFTRRVPSRSLWFAQRFLRGSGLVRTVEWKSLAELPELPRFRHCVCVLNNQLYVLGGRKYYGAQDILKSVIRYDPAQDHWDRVADMHSPRDYFATACLAGKVYVFGGNHDDTRYLNTVEFYTPDDNTWRLAQPLDRALCGHAAAVLGGEIFISGGCDTRLGCLPYLWRYDPSHGCSSRAPMVAGVGRAGHAMQALGGKLLVVGGLQPLWAGFGDQLQCEAYDPTLDTWVAIPRLPRPHLFPAAVHLDGVMYVLGGSSVDTARDTPWVHRYDPRTGCWDNLGKLPHPYADLAAAVLHLPGGAKE
ncbi:kelch-like protein 26 isoform X2 [Brienomyrus brachyistius]|uniref:kelch-like protein 26 isoform X2 n=1 Tax=Brienomyrus brachyistius TaxID=42636 RepID=UPI0020B3DDF7|nr:kelch-like protein 26 isoform X2 [Brienomyrus brachyistius]